MFTLPELPYPYGALEPYIDTETMKIHHDKHHAAYVDNLNKVLEGRETLLKMSVEEILKGLDGVPQEIRARVRNHGGGHANHSFFWTIMAPSGSTEVKSRPKMDSPFIKAINAAFSSPQTFKEKFTAAAMGRFGSGWAWLVVNKGKAEIMDTANQDSPLSEGKTPILGLDIWEHAYYLKYQNRRADYINAWWQVVNWKQVEENFNKAVK